MGGRPAAVGYALEAFSGHPPWLRLRSLRQTLAINRCTGFCPLLLASWQQKRAKAECARFWSVLEDRGSIGSVKDLDDLQLGKARNGPNVIKVRSPVPLDPLVDNALWTAETALQDAWSSFRKGPPPVECSASTFG